MFHSVVFGGVAEAQRGASGATGSLESLWYGYLDLRGVRAENEALRGEVDELRIALQQERAAAERAECLRRLLEFRAARRRSTTTGAQVIATGASPEFRTVTIDKGTTTASPPTWRWWRRPASSGVSRCRVPAPRWCS